MRKGLLAFALGTAVAAGGALVVPASAAHWDPRQERWVIDCSSAPAYDNSKATSGWEPFAGPANGSGYVFGARSNDPYVIARLDPNAKTVTVAAWQPWYDDHATAGVVYGPWFVDDSVTVGPNGPSTCEKSIKPTVKPPTAAATSTRPAR